MACHTVNVICIEADVDKPSSQVFLYEPISGPRPHGTTLGTTVSLLSISSGLKNLRHFCLKRQMSFSVSWIFGYYHAGNNLAREESRIFTWG